MRKTLIQVSFGGFMAGFSSSITLHNVMQGESAFYVVAGVFSVVCGIALVILGFLTND